MISRTTLEKNERGMIINEEREMIKFYPGGRVKIYNQKLDGKEFFEGLATVISGIDGQEGRYVVRFDNGELVNRFIDPSKQSVLEIEEREI